jgi:hypothetical protein
MPTFACHPALLLLLLCVSALASAGETAPAAPAAPAASDAIIPLAKAKLQIYEDFESTAVGQIPKGYTKSGAVGVVEGVSHGGTKSLRMEAAVNGPRRITIQGAPITALGGQFWGRLFFKVQLPNPEPMGGGGFPVIHSTLVAGSAQSPQFKDPIEVRLLDTVLGPNHTYQYIYNVQPRKRGEFGTGSKYDYKFTDEWSLAEWFVDFATQTYRLYINGKEITDVAIHKGAGNFEKVELPEVWESISFGWNNYQNAGTGFVAWIDDLALGKDRIGGEMPAVPGKGKKPPATPAPAPASPPAPAPAPAPAP